MDINWTKRPNQQFYKFKRTDLIAWYVDDCNEEKTIREDYVSYMENYVKVDIYGKCGNMDCKPGKVSIVIQIHKYSYSLFRNDKKYMFDKMTYYSNASKYMAK